MPVLTTDGRAIHSPSREFVTLYAPDGTTWTGAPVDAQEVLMSGQGYSTEPPAKQADEQQPKQQPVADNDPEQTAEGEAQTESFSANAESVEVGKEVKVARRSRK